MYYLLRLGVTAGQHLEILGHGTTARLAHFACHRITDPTMDTSSAGIDPKEVLEAEVLPKHVKNCDTSSELT